MKKLIKNVQEEFKRGLEPFFKYHTKLKKIKTTKKKKTKTKEITLSDRIEKNLNK